ncbi:ABC transporter ATP-binding protein [Bacillus sp. S/N-304-OC-R1]|uniref:ABC transporter ATP-binding protein n=1 Tax=Bacillus sp. S/N-304-OC-R1 TaxID=2758034 RepID=UPI001C8D81EB|nr:ABC transporter ATP-binding protein [Bacillus sp. S/N-304-OC-R1]MBY0122815.1 ABC transporter ATP-binding protein [Bacillus sp. S/N-304-OC-R1]
MNESILKVEHISKVYHSAQGHPIKALNGVDLELKRGELVIIMGASGSGKSTFLNIIGGLDQPSEGKIFIEGKEIKDFHKEPQASTYRKKYIGFVFQFFNLLSGLTVYENVSLPLLLKKKPINIIKKETEKILKMVGLYERKKHLPSQLSGGQQQRVALARALIHKPAILLADEPTGNLDSKTTEEMMNLIVQMRNEFNQAIMLVTHDPFVALYGDRILMFRDGQIMAEYREKQKTRDEKLKDITELFRQSSEVACE